MTTEQRVQWVALPAGAAEGGELLLSMFVAPRLRSDTGDTLGRYPDFVDWPAIVRAATWQVAVAGDPATAVDAVAVGPTPDSALWAALFPADTAVEPYTFDDYADRPLVTFGVGAIIDSLRRLYARVAAASPGDLPRRRGNPQVDPPVIGLDDLLGELGRVVDGRLWRVSDDDEGRRVVAALLADARHRSHARRTGPLRGTSTPVEPLGPGGSEYERALFFHSRPDAEPTSMPEDGGHYRRTVDFHQSVAALGDHAGLMRMLGLIVDLRLPPDALPLAPVAAPGTVRVLPTLPDLPLDVAGEVSRVAVTHDTAYVLADVADEGIVFAAAPRKPDPLGPEGGVPTGLAALPETAFRLEQLDVDGAAIKAIHTAASVYLPASSEAEHPLHQPDSAGLPALRSSGLALVQTGRAAALQGEFGNGLGVNAATENGAPALLHAEDLVLGHRLDVFDAGRGRWFSTTARTETATAERYAGDLPADTGEGFSQLSLAGAASAPGAQSDPDGELYVHETVLTWDGWSLAAPRPGASLSRDSRAPHPDAPETQPARIANTAETSIGLSFDSSVAPGTLPRLRFGRSYRVRLREVDLAGNGTTMAVADRWLASPAAATPALPARTSSPYLRFEPVPAPAVVPATAYAEGASVLRLVVRSNGEGVAAWTAAFNAEHAEGQPEPHAPYDEVDQRHLAPPKASFDLAERHGMFDLVLGADGAPDQTRLDEITAAYQVARRERGTFDDPEAPDAQVVVIEAEPPTVAPGPQAARGPQRYIIHRAASLELPYLPDPLALGVVFFGLPGRLDVDPLRLEFDGLTWHERRPLRLHLADGVDEPGWDPDARVLTVHLPAGGRATIRVASALEALDLMAMREWCERELDGAELDDVLRAMLENRSWLTTPWHTVELVHAVQQPLAAPEVVQFDVSRDYGAPSAHLTGEVVTHVGSSEKIDLLATWTEQVDDPDEPEGPHEREAATAVFDVALATAALVPRPTRGEDAYALVDEKVVTFNTALKARPGLPPGPLSHHFGDTRHRLVTYTVRATSSFREYFPAVWMDRPELLSRDSQPLPVHVPASAPPGVPAVLYAVPTLRWEDRSTAEATVRVRGGGGVRVWLERGWWSSGSDEKLAVVIGSSLADSTQPVYHLMTFVGQDMTRGGGKVASPEEDSFPNSAGVVTNVTLLEGPTGVRLVTFEPVFDPSTRRWFCDIDVDTGQAYMPLLRLALVRYQPYALSGCSVSRVLLVDIVQTLPDRTLTVTREAGGGPSVLVTVAGPSYTSIAGLGGVRTDAAVLARVTCRVQRRPAGGPPAELAWEDTEADAVLLAPSFDGPVATWTGRVDVEPTPDGAEQRLLVLEEDRLPVDEQTPSVGGFVDRVVFAAAVAL